MTPTRTDYLRQLRNRVDRLATYIEDPETFPEWLLLTEINLIRESCDRIAESCDRVASPRSQRLN